MFKVQSLKRTITVQFAVILVPLTILLAFQATRQAQRSAEMNSLFHHHELAVQARDAYRTFVNGATDAVDTGRLSRPAIDALSNSARTLGRLGDEAASTALAATARDMTAMAADLTRAPGLPSLEQLQPAINANREAIREADARYERWMDEAISRSIAAVGRDNTIVGAVSALLLLLTIGFIMRMIRDLSRPLNLAVSVANRIAEGREVTAEEFRGQRDLGNLLHSLEGMHGNLGRYRAEVETTQRRLEQQVREVLDSRSSLNEAQQLAQVGNWSWDLIDSAVQWSDQMYRILGTDPGGCAPTMTTAVELLEPKAQWRSFKERLQSLTRQGGSFSDEIHIRGLDGRTRTIHQIATAQVNDAGRVIRVCGTIQDITMRRQAEQEIRRLAHYDSLTGLPNRQFFYDHLEHAVARARREGEQLATLFLDLDRFKRINDTLGHAAGDALLKEVAHRLSDCLRESDCLGREGEIGDAPAPEAIAPGDFASGVARLAGDEFTAVLVALKRPQDAARVAQRILQSLARPFMIGGNELSVTASVGISLFPGDGSNADELLKHADTAMYRAKELGKNTYQFFTEDMNTTAIAKLTLEADLRKAIERDQFVLYYQPKIDAQSGRIGGVEALIRWVHPDWGLMAPGQFIPLAEEVGLITEIGDWVLETACRQLRAWRGADLPLVSVAINLAGPSFGLSDLALRVQGALQRHDVEPRLLHLEATESMMMTNVERTSRTLVALRKIGVKLAIDDFGTGYSSLSYLRKFPIDQLKIDRSFVTDMTNNVDDAAIVAAIISLGRTLGLEVVAEGVETHRQARRLREMGCDSLQGYYFSRPVPAGEIAALLRRSAYAIDAPSTMEAVL